MKSLLFTADGIPAPQGSKRIVPTSRGPRVIESSGEKLKTWRRTVTAAAARAHVGGPITGPVVVTVNFHLVAPQRPRFTTPAARPDLDKLLRAVLDALTDAEVWEDDGQVIALSASKRWSSATYPPGATILVERVNE